MQWLNYDRYSQNKSCLLITELGSAQLVRKRTFKCILCMEGGEASNFSHWRRVPQTRAAFHPRPKKVETAFPHEPHTLFVVTSFILITNRL